MALLTDAGNNRFWQGRDLDQAMTTAPGVAAWSISKIPLSKLTTDLGKYEVLVISAPSRTWVNASVQSAIANWVQAGGLLVLAPETDLAATETVLAGLGSSFALNWVKESWIGESPSLASATDPLFTTPNALNATSCSGSGFACKDGTLIDKQTLGSAWTKLAIASGPAHQGKAIIGAARAGSGAVLAVAVNFSNTPTAGQFLFGENLVRYFDVLTPSDTLPPTVELSPLPSPTSNPSLAVSGRVQDAGGIGLVQVLVNGVLAGNLSPAADGTVTTTVQLPLEGANTITLRATDLAGNTGTASAAVVLDTTAPAVSITAPVSLTNQSLLQVSGRATDSEGLASVSFLLNGAVVATPTPTATGDVSASVTLVEGTNTISLVAIDNAGNRSVAQTTVVLDTAQPTAYFHASLPTLTNTAELTVTGTVLDPSGITTVSVSVNGTVVATPAPVDGVITVALTLAEGENTLVLRAVDGAGNVGADERQVVVDTLPPTLTILSPSEGAAFGISDVAVSVQVEDRTAIELQVGDQGASYAAGTATFSPVLQLAAEGWNQVLITARDAAGNTSSKTLNLLLDFTAPVLGIDVVDGAQFGPLPGNLLLFSITVDDLGATSVAMPSGQYALERGGGVLQDAFPLSEGVNALTIVVTDEVGHTSTLVRNVTYDLTPPTGRIASPGAGAFVRGTSDFSVEAEDNLTGVAGVSVTIDGTPVPSSQTPEGTWYSALDTSLMGDGLHQATVRLTDGVGNYRDLQTSFTVDNTPPTLTLGAPADGSYKSGSISLVASASDATSGVGSVVIRVNGSEVGRCEADSCTVAFDTRTLPDGAFTVTADATDRAGNSAASVQHTAIADNTAPEKFLVSPAAGALLTRTMTVAVDVNDPNFQSVECFVGGQSLGASTDPHFSRTVDLLGQLDGQLTVRCEATDLAGNVGTESATVSVRNWTEELNPRTLNLKSSAGANSVTLYVEGANVALLASDDLALMLRVPGGKDVGALDHPGSAVGDYNRNGIPDIALKFDRQALISSIRAGIEARTIDPRLALTVRLLAQRLDINPSRSFVQEVGSDSITLKQ